MVSFHTVARRPLAPSIVDRESGCSRADTPWQDRHPICQFASIGFEWTRFFFATFAPCFPKAVRTLRERWLIVFLRFAAEAAFLIFRRAADFCFALDIQSGSIYRKKQNFGGHANNREESS